MASRNKNCRSTFETVVDIRREFSKTPVFPGRLATSCGGLCKWVAVCDSFYLVRNVLKTPKSDVAKVSIS
jgi:hypothetical protein